jgi:bifunctional enzyme CysN/CysC
MNAMLQNETIETYLDRHQRKELLRLLTCGSVDDGKSTLIGRLLHDTRTIYEDQLAAVARDSQKFNTTGKVGAVDLALLTDGLKAEREQGITIDVAYRYFSTDKRKFIIADTPGHEQYTRNMATGASTSQLAIILIDARHGVVTQTRRHSFIVSQLGIRHVVVAINKMDLVDYSEETFTRIRDQYSGFVAKLGITDVQFIPLSALNGDNVVEKSAAMPWYQGPPLLAHLETVHIASDRNLTDFRFPVQYVLRPNLAFRGFAGTVASGIVRKGDPIVALPSGKKSRVRSIVTMDGELPEAFAGQAITLTLEDEIDVSRGDMLLLDGNGRPHLSHEIHAMVVWMHEKPLVAGRSYWIKHTTRTVAAEIAAFHHAIDVNTLEKRPTTQLALNEMGRVVLSLNQPLVYDAYANNPATGSFIIIDRVTNTTVGAGMISDTGHRPDGAQWDEAAPATLKLRRGHVTTDQREERNGHKAVTILLTGLTGSGKASVAFALEKRLFDAGAAVTALYGQNMRAGLSRDLGFSADDRSENLRRSAEVAKILNDSGHICIAAFVAPHEAVRQRAKSVIGDSRFLEVYLSAPIEYCRRNDPTGAYAKADSGALAQFPGVSATFEPPANPDLVLPTHEITVDESVTRIIRMLEARGFLAPR